MKKFIVLAALAVFTFTNVQAQDGQFTAGIHLGLPVGDIEEVTTFNLGADFAYLFNVNDTFWVGPMVGISNFFFDDDLLAGSGIDVDDITYAPIGGTALFYLGQQFYFGADLGYAIGITDGLDGGVYYQPKAGYDFGKVMLSLGYRVVSESDIDVSSIALGAAYKF